MGTPPPVRLEVAIQVKHRRYNTTLPRHRRINTVPRPGMVNLPVTILSTPLLQATKATLGQATVKGS